jgi:hypothetical protein
MVRPALLLLLPNLSRVANHEKIVNDPEYSSHQVCTQYRDRVCQTAKLLRQANKWRNIGDEWKDKLVADILDVMAHGLSYVDRGRITNELREVIDTALRQDEIISMQQADVRWKYPSSAVLVDYRCRTASNFVAQAWISLDGSGSP